MAANEGASVRAEAARVVDAVAASGRSLDDALENARDFDKPENNALLRYLAYGAVRRHWRLSDWTSKLLQKPLRGRDSVVAALLRVGMFQIADSRVPDHALSLIHI